METAILIAYLVMVGCLLIITLALTVAVIHAAIKSMKKD